jgi:hypothetical protein
MRQDDGIGVVASATFAVRRPGRLSYATLAAAGLGIAIVLIVVWDAAVADSAGEPVAKVAEVSPA